MVFLYFFGFCVEKFYNRPFWEVKFFFLEIGHIGYQKIESFMLISKKQTCLSDKMPPKKDPNKKLFTNFANSNFFCFIIVTFFGGRGAFCRWGKFAFLKSAKYSRFFDTPYDLFQGKRFSPLRRAVFQIFWHKNQKKIETPKTKEKCLF
jgi:hypothetical protein